MTVPKSLRSESKFEVIVKSMDLAVYTLKIVSNERTFSPAFRDSLGTELTTLAKDIFIDCHTANQTNLFGGPEKRRDLQDHALTCCERLMALMLIAQRTYHLDTKRIEYWGGMTLDCLNLIKRWKESDNKRLKERYDSS